MPFAEPAEDGRRLEPYFARRSAVLRVIGASAVAAVLGWTIYRDLLSRRSLPSPSVVERQAAPSSANQAFPISGFVVADFQPGDVAGAGLMLQTPDDEPGLLFVVAFEDQETGTHVAHAFLKTNTIETLHLPPGRYRTVIAEGRVWHGLAQLFGPDTRVVETIGYMP